ncbi:MAG: PQQ-dependent sugar dehydrogenase [Thermoleophilia bacterium]|nr:PQQ-dependent sugar dehydrogenase [Thermoleophilia bacterium]
MRLIALALAAAALAGCGSGEPAGEPPPAPEAETAPAGTAAEAGAPEVEAAAGAKLKLRLVEVVGGLAAPVHVAAAPGEPNRVYIVEQAGTIRVLEGGELRSSPFLDLRSLVRSGGEQGLLSVAFHPDYASNRRFYVDYTDRRGDTRVVEYEARTSGQPVKRRQLLWVDQPYENHNGGQLAFGPDGLLYVGMGDGGSGGDPGNRAQNLSSRLGKLLRLNVDRADAKWQLAGYGLRNPWRFSFDRSTGDLWIADVGQDRWEEIDFTRRSSPGLENYGWDVYEGRERYEDRAANPAGKLVGPIHVYGRDNGCSVTGGFVYRGSAIPAAGGRYFFGDYCSGRIWSLRQQSGKATDVRRHSLEVESLSSFGEGPGGELYLVSLDGAIYRLTGG